MARLPHSPSELPATEFVGSSVFPRKWTIMKGESGMAKSAVQHSKVVSQAKWLEARKELLKKEKEFSRLRDELSRQRREMPWEKVEKGDAFEGPGGKETLAGLLGGRSPVVVYPCILGH